MNFVHKRFILTLVTLVIIASGALVAGYIAKGYRLSPQTGTLVGTGIISAISVPDQASIYLDGHLISATNANINSLSPKSYHVKIHKDGFIDWEKNVEVREGLVTEVKATLFPALPSTYPLTYTGAINPSLSPDGQKLAFIVPGTTKKSGVWAWTFTTNQIGFTRGGEPHQVMLPQPDVDLTNATMKWSPDSKQILLTVGEHNYLLEQGNMNDPAKDITPILDPTMKSWAEDQRILDQAKLALITDLQIRKVASSSAMIQWSPDETKFIYSTDKVNYKSVDIKLGKTYDLPVAKSYAWLPDSLHLAIVEQLSGASPSPVAKASPSASPAGLLPTFPVGKISLVEYEGTNLSTIFAGNFDTSNVYVWPDGSRLVMLYSLPTPTGSTPNLYGINLK